MNRKMSKKTPELHPIPVKAPWHHVGIDFIGPLQPTTSRGNKYILTLSDYFTKFVEAVPLPNKTAFGVANSLFKVNSYYMYMYVQHVCMCLHTYALACCIILSWLIQVSCMYLIHVN